MSALRTDDWALTRVTVQHQYDTTTKTSFLAYHKQCCREEGMNMDVFMKIDLRDGNTASPQSIPIAPVMQYKLGETHILHLAPTDADGQTVKCKRTTWADSGIRGIETATFYGQFHLHLHIHLHSNFVTSSDKCTFVQKLVQLCVDTDISEDCQLTINLPVGAGNVGKYFEVQIIMFTEDDQGGIIDEIPLDFSLKGIPNDASPPTCDIITPRPQNGFEINVGESLTIEWDVSSDTTVDMNVVSVSEYGSAEATLEGDKLIYEVSIPDYGPYDISLDGLQVGAAIQLKDTQGLVALCNVGITIRSDVDRDGTRDREDDNMDDYDDDTILNDADNCPLVSWTMYFV